MARSTKIYVVVNNNERDPEDSLIGAFTVRHELLSWLQSNESHPDWDAWTVLTTGDGVYQKAGKVSVFDWMNHL